YSVFNLSALMLLAQESQMAGVDLWDYRAPDGASIRAALNYLLPYAEGPKKWTHQNLNGLHPSGLTIPLLRAAEHYHDSAYLRYAEKLENKPTAEVLLLEEHARGTAASR
ncbi:MAG TPA: alginate lyase family protein, partial [Acidobacteriaceae bacterium]|nr:alginate lyase family protein [Acidobacteriaceae bacterium]